MLHKYNKNNVYRKLADSFMDIVRIIVRIIERNLIKMYKKFAYMKHNDYLCGVFIYKCNKIH